MDYSVSSHKPANEHAHIGQDDGLIIVQDESDPDPLLLSSFSTLPMGIYSPLPSECPGGLSPCSLPEISSYSTSTASSSRRPSIQESLSFCSDRRGSAQFEPQDWFSFSTSDTLQERAESGAVLTNGRVSCQRSNSATVHTPNSNTPLFRCRWEGCQSSTLFRRETDLLRHIKTIHISPEAYPCPEANCDRVFGRKDHVAQHMKRRHPR
ncbi:uncharacterized protein BDV17DRAFT_264895 [Aspergillus undulatus]|uniref:uncharacterized protein n=1 Tax=Aspergillus undulatus TaxID=1810928 RepID=UPI003CCD1BE1